MLSSCTQVEINESVHRNFCVLNTGKFHFSFSWEFSGPKALQRFLSIAPENGTVEAGERVQAQLTFHPLKTCILKDMELKLKVLTRVSYAFLPADHKSQANPFGRESLLEQSLN